MRRAQRSAARHAAAVASRHHGFTSGTRCSWRTHPKPRTTACAEPPQQAVSCVARTASSNRQPAQPARQATSGVLRPCSQQKRQGFQHDTGVYQAGAHRSINRTFHGGANRRRRPPSRTRPFIFSFCYIYTLLGIMAGKTTRASQSPDEGPDTQCECLTESYLTH